MTREEAIKKLNELYMRADITDQYGDMEDMTPYEEAIEIATTALEQEQKWIPIDADNMPKEGVEVLFTVAEGEWLYHEPAVLSGWFVSKYQEFEIDDEGRSVKLEEVTAWMPLPEPYQAESEGD